MTVTWNAADKSANITLSGSNLVATATSSTQGAVRANFSASSGKYYYECKFAIDAPFFGSSVGIGWANATAALSSYIGLDLNGVSGILTNFSLGGVFLNNTVIGVAAGPTVAGATIGCAFDIGAKLIWFRMNGGYWNDNPLADPAAGTGGYSVSTLNAGPYFPVFCSNLNATSVTANFGATPLPWAVPSGFSTVDSLATTYVEITKMSGVAVMGTPPLAATLTKLSGYDVFGTPQRAATITKLMGYLIYDQSRSLPTTREMEVSQAFIH